MTSGLVGEMQHQLLPSVAPWVTMATTLAAMIVSSVFDPNHYVFTLSLSPCFSLALLTFLSLSLLFSLYFTPGHLSSFSPLPTTTLLFPLLSLSLSPPSPPPLYYSSSSIHLVASSPEALATSFLPQGLPSHPHTLCLCLVSLWMARS